MATLRSITAGVRAARPRLTVVQAYLDVASPSLVSVVAAAAGPAVVVPVLLSGGYHVRSDIPSTLADRPEIRATPPLGPDPAIAHALLDRLASARGDSPAGDAVILVAAGSSDASARRDVELAAVDLSALAGRPVEVAVLSGPGRSIADVRASRGTATLEIATYLLAEGAFSKKLDRDAVSAGITTVAAPIGAHPAIIGLVLDRYFATVENPGWPGSGGL